jgi:hypothetical protein
MVVCRGVALTPGQLQQLAAVVGQDAVRHRGFFFWFAVLAPPRVRR